MATKAVVKWVQCGACGRWRVLRDGGSGGHCGELGRSCEEPCDYDGDNPFPDGARVYVDDKGREFMPLFEAKHGRVDQETMATMKKHRADWQAEVNKTIGRLGMSITRDSALRVEQVELDPPLGLTRLVYASEHTKIDLHKAEKSRLTTRKGMPGAYKEALLNCPFAFDGLVAALEPCGLRNIDCPPLP